MDRANIWTTLLAVVGSCTLSLAIAAAHPPDEFDAASSRVWTNARTGERVTGAFLSSHGGKVVVTTPSGELATIPLADLAPDAKAEADARIAAIRAVNDALLAQAVAPSGAKPPQAAVFDAFAPFVTTRFDERWLYVESDGMPHEPLAMAPMVGITSWQQQVPLPQPYRGTNAWQIPLKPELADQPISGRNALMRGAVALAANGVPIFNALNNRGVDTLAVGELDQFGGHAGRGDDYHYHAAPLFIEKVVGKGKAIAYALDGFPIYGLFDPQAKPGDEKACPCGSQEPLDELNGHFCTVPKGEGIGGGTRSYHYHASTTFPYINGGLRGKATLEGSGNESQVVPQPRANVVREWLQPLKGARITGFEQKGPKAWSLRYEVDGAASFVNYRVEDSGKVVFDFVGPDGAKRTEEYSGRGEGGPPREGRGGRRGQGGGDRPPPPPPPPPAGSPPPSEAPKKGLALSSSGLDPRGLLDARFTCDGESIAPPFAWSGLPAGTKSLALTIHHITPDDTERVYLVLSGIPASTTSLAAGQSALGHFGKNSVNDRAEYAPPCSKGPGEKRYVATLYALSAEPAVPSGASPTRSELLAAIKEITLGSATLELRYARPNGAASDPDRPRGQEKPRGLLDRMTAFQTDVPVHPIDVVLMQPTATSIVATVMVAEQGRVVLEHWTPGSTRRSQSAVVPVEPGKLASILIDGLAAGAEHRYRVGLLKDGASTPAWGEEGRFRTKPGPGRAFRFAIQADSHLDANMDTATYAATLRTVRAEAMAGRADFLVDLGDTFMTDKRGQDYERARPQYDAQRYYFGLVCDAAPLFMVLGNHDGEKGSAPRGMGAWSYRERTERFPPLAIDGRMYSGDTSFREGHGANHYAFEWGNALVVVLDPFWPTTERTRDGGGGAGGGAGVAKLEPVDSSWGMTLGREQYDWLAETLAASKAKQKFVFIHHLVGGIGGPAARGGVESVPFFEWGGRNADGSEGFAQHRSGWPMPIHQLLVKNGVTAVFHGHDHLYVHGPLDGIHYQCVPQPGNIAGGTRSADEYGYASGTILGSPGWLGVGVADDGTATVEFIRTAAEGRGGGKASEANGTVVDRYTIAPRGG